MAVEPPEKPQLDRIEQALWAGQIGEVERVESRLRDEGVVREDRLAAVFDAKLSSLKAWGVAALLGGQTLAAVIGSVVVKTGHTDTARAAVRAVANFF